MHIDQKKSPTPIHLLIDEGREKPGVIVGNEIFNDWKEPFTGCYCSSRSEPLLQMADFLAYSINRATYLSTKANRTETDTQFMALVGSMNINSPNIVSVVLSVDSGVKEFDEFHKNDREKKGLK